MRGRQICLVLPQKVVKFKIKTDTQQQQQQQLPNRDVNTIVPQKQNHVKDFKELPKSLHLNGSRTAKLQHIKEHYMFSKAFTNTLGYQPHTLNLQPQY